MHLKNKVFKSCTFQGYILTKHDPKTLFIQFIEYSISLIFKLSRTDEDEGLQAKYTHYFSGEIFILFIDMIIPSVNIIS